MFILLFTTRGEKMIIEDGLEQVYKAYQGMFSEVVGGFSLCGFAEKQLYIKILEFTKERVVMDVCLEISQKIYEEYWIELMENETKKFLHGFEIRFGNNLRIEIISKEQPISYGLASFQFLLFKSKEKVLNELKKKNEEEKQRKKLTINTGKGILLNIARNILRKQGLVKEKINEEYSLKSFYRKGKYYLLVDKNVNKNLKRRWRIFIELDKNEYLQIIEKTLVLILRFCDDTTKELNAYFSSKGVPKSATCIRYCFKEGEYILEILRKTKFSKETRWRVSVPKKIEISVNIYSDLIPLELFEELKQQIEKEHE